MAATSGNKISSEEASVDVTDNVMSCRGDNIVMSLGLALTQNV